MGAVPGGCLLTVPGARGDPGAFDVEPFRAAGRRVVLRNVHQPLLVLGSGQPDSIVDADRARERETRVVRRRSGGAAVLLVPGAQIWVDLWVPRQDPLWSSEPRTSAVVAGEWWVRALLSAPLAEEPDALTVHRAGSVPAYGSDVVCFAGVGPGEVVRGGRKVVGLAQWRSREGVLVHGCVYRRWDPEPLVALLALPAPERRALVDALRDAALGLEDLGLEDMGAGSWGHEHLVGALPEPPPWEVVRT